MNFLRVKLLISVFAALIIFSCKKDRIDNPEQNSDIIGVWKVVRGFDYDMVDGVKIEDTKSPYDADNLYMLRFDEDLTVITLKNQNKQIGSGKYRFDKANRKIVITDRGETVDFNISRITDTDLDIDFVITDDKAQTLHEIYLTRQSGN